VVIICWNINISDYLNYFLELFADSDKFSWLENYAGSGSNSTQLTCGKRVDQLELDRWESPLTFCPLLKDPSSYIPDTVDLNSDKEARLVVISEIVLSNLIILC